GDGSRNRSDRGSRGHTAKRPENSSLGRRRVPRSHPTRLRLRSADGPLDAHPWRDPVSRARSAYNRVAHRLTSFYSSRASGAPACSTVSVAELAIGHMIALLRHLPEADRTVRTGKWEKGKLEGRELFGKTLGLLGSGRIGAEVAKRAQALGMPVIAYDPYLPV